jgi:hypothetical protein
MRALPLSIGTIHFVGIARRGAALRSLRGAALKSLRGAAKGNGR